MYKKNLLKKSLVVGIIVLFIGAGVATGINGKINRNDIDEKTFNISSVVSNQEICSLTFNIFDKTEEKQKNVNIPVDAANKIYETFEELEYMIVHEPRSVETQALKIEFVDLLDSYGLLPVGLSKDYVLSLLNPSWLKNKQQTPKTKTTLSKSYLPPVVEKIVNLLQIFKNCFGKTVLNIFDKNTFLSPSGKINASATFCSISSIGFGTTLPLFLLPRPRAIAAWNSPDGFTSVGELLAPRGFYAGGEQSGSMFGFTGMGLTYALPGYIVYGFVGYALYTRVSADDIEFFPPNQVPVISDEQPPSGTGNVPVSLSELSFKISDADGDLMDYTVTTEPNIGSGSGNNKNNGVYTIKISGLEGDKSYKWTVEVTDGQSIAEKVYSFFTESRPFDPFHEGWQYRKKITIDHTKVAGDLTNFPILINVVDPDLCDKAQDDGDDILFMDGFGVASRLYHEIESFDDSSGKLIAWVNIPSLPSNVDLDIYMYYGNPGCSSQQFVEKVWDTSYCGVWHLNYFFDSTINENDGTNHGTDDCLGKIGKAKDFIGTNQEYIDLGNMPQPADGSTTKATFEVWINPEELENNVGIITKWDNNYEPDRRSCYICLKNTRQFEIGIFSGTWYPSGKLISAVTDDNLLSTDIWQHIAVVVDLSTKNIDLYYNGEEKSSTISIEGIPPDYFYDIDVNEWLGKYGGEGGNSYYTGFMDEVKISKTCRSASWISTQYSNQNDPSSFFSIGPEETSP